MNATVAFLLAVGVGLLLPPLLARGLRLQAWLPLVFVQLLAGVVLGSAGMEAPLREYGIDLAAGPLAEGLRGLGLLGLCLLVGLGGSHAVARADPSDRRRCALISAGGFALALTFGSAFGYLLATGQPALLGPRADDLRFALAVGVALAVTALPVLLALLAQLGLESSRVGKIAAGAAVIDELWLWLALGLLSLPAGASPARLGWQLAGMTLLVVVMGLIVRPALAAWLARHDGVAPGERMAIGVAAIVLAAAATQAIGLHAALGAFVAGVLLPRAALEGWREQALAVAQHLLLPFFFVLTGMALRVELHDVSFWLLAALVSAVGIGAKFLASSTAARLTGLPWREACALGSLMQCKGLMELVAVGLLLQAGLISPRLGGALAMMALASTLATPLLWRAVARRWAN